MTHPTLTERSVTTADVDAFKAHLLAWGRSPNTARAYCTDLTMFLQECDPTTNTFATTAAGWITSHRGDWAASTTKRRLASMNQFAEFIGVPGLAKYQRPVDAQRSYTGVDIEAVRDVLAKLRGADLGLDINDSRDAYAMVALCGAAGLRVGEAVAVEHDHVTDHGGETLELYVHGKGGRDRIVPFPRNHYDHLCHFASWKFHNVSSPDRGRWLIRKVFDRAGYRAVESHQLRHAYATALFDLTKDIVLVQRTLGHANVTTTQRYINTSYGQQAAAVVALGV